MRRSLDWKRHPLLVASAAVLAGVLVLEAGRAVAAAALPALAVLLMDRFGRLRTRRPAQAICVRVPQDFDYEEAFDPCFRRCTLGADLTDIHSPAPGAGTDLLYTVRLKQGESVGGLMRDIEGAIAGRRDGQDGR
jgi:hypothetical protein